MRRSFLALQGTASPFFCRLGDALRDRGHRVCKVNFCGGDVAYSGSVDVLNYRDGVNQLPEWYGELVRRGDFTDVVMFGDCREVHRHMHAVSRAAQLAVHVFEEGYVRPYWITLEQHGVNGRSLLPRDPAWYLVQRGTVPPAPDALATGYNLYERAFHDICYRAANSLYAWRFPKYRSHRPKNGLIEYAGLAYRALQQRRHHRHADGVTQELLRAGRPYYLFPLQLNSDAQIIEHSPFGGICDAITQVIRSFAGVAPSDALLVIKNHPLDTGLIDYRKHVEQLAMMLDIADRIRFIDSGHLPTLLDHARGVVVVNSTVGLSALHHRRPLIALGTAIYDMPGLTWQGTLDEFWCAQIGPNPVLYQAFIDCVIHYTQVNGDFYTRTGIEMATAGAIQRFEAQVG